MTDRNRCVLPRLASAAAALGVASALAAQPVIYVDDDAPAGGDGTSWNAAFRDLQDALSGTGSQSREIEIRIAQGTYTPDGGTGIRTRAFAVAAPTIHSGVTIWLKGGFAGRGAINPDLRDPETFVTILSGDLNGDDKPGFVNRSDNSTNVVVLPELQFSKPGFSGLTIRGGNTTGRTAPFDSGGGVLVLEGFGTGGPVFEDCVLTDNQAIANGGGIAVLQGSRPRITGCTIENNAADHAGGGLSILDARDPRLVRCVVRGNHAPEAAGVDVSTPDSAWVEACTVADNAATNGPAGGVRVRGSSVIVNSLFYGNIGATGAAVEVEQGVWGGSTIANCAFSKNTAVDNAAVALIQADTSGEFWLANTIVWDNSSPPNAQIRVAGSNCTAHVEYCVAQGGPSCVSVPAPAALQWGAGNRTGSPRFVDPDGLDFRLAAFSPCIDAGHDYLIPWGAEDDLAGKDRFRDDPWMPNGGGTQNWKIDMGPYESQWPSCYPDFNRSGTLTTSDFFAFQSAFGAGNPNADCNEDGFLNLADFGCFQTRFSLGCP